MMTKKELNERFKEVVKIYHSPIEYDPKNPYWFIQSDEVQLYCMEQNWEFSVEELLGIFSSNVFTLGIDTVAMAVERILKKHSKVFKESNPLLLDMLKKFVDSLKTDLVQFAALKENEYYSVNLTPKDPNTNFIFEDFNSLAQYISHKNLRGKNFTILKIEDKGDESFNSYSGSVIINALGCISNINGSAKLNNRLWEELECSDIYIPNSFLEDELVFDTSSGIIGLVCMDYEEDEDLDPGSVLVKVYDKASNNLVFHRFPVISTDYYELDDEKRFGVLKTLENFRIKELMSKI